MLSSTSYSNRKLRALEFCKPAGVDRAVEGCCRAKLAAPKRVGFRTEMLAPHRRRLFGISLTLSAILAGCSSRPGIDNGPLFGNGVFHPPPKPGASISQTRMCECKACEPSNCCDGPEDDAPPATCGSGDDFSSNDACGLAVRSCTSRCTREVWRVNNAETCAAKRPVSCCHAG